MANATRQVRLLRIYYTAYCYCYQRRSPSWDKVAWHATPYSMRHHGRYQQIWREKEGSRDSLTSILTAKLSSQTRQVASSFAS